MPRAVMIPRGVHERLQGVSLLLYSERNDPVEVTVHVREASQSGDFSSTRDLTTAVAKVAPGRLAWVKFPVDCAVASTVRLVLAAENRGRFLATDAERTARRVPGLWRRCETRVDGGSRPALRLPDRSADGHRLRLPAGERHQRRGAGSWARRRTSGRPIPPRAAPMDRTGAATAGASQHGVPDVRHGPEQPLPRRAAGVASVSRTIGWSTTTEASGTCWPRSPTTTSVAASTRFRRSPPTSSA